MGHSNNQSAIAKSDGKAVAQPRKSRWNEPIEVLSDGTISPQCSYAGSQGNLSNASSEQEVPTFVKSLHQSIGPAMDAELVVNYKAALYAIRARLPQAVVHTIQEELRTEGPIPRTFKRVNFELSPDPKGPNVGAVIKRRIEKKAKRVPREKVERILDNWLGKTKREKRVSLEVLGQMSQILDGPEMKKFPTLLMLNHEYHSVEATLRHLEPDEAKELCNDWNPVRRGSDAYQDFPSTEELSLVAKRFVDMLARGLNRFESLFPEQRWTTFRTSSEHFYRLRKSS